MLVAGLAEQMKGYLIHTAATIRQNDDVIGALVKLLACYFITINVFFQYVYLSPPPPLVNRGEVHITMLASLSLVLYF